MAKAGIDYINFPLFLYVYRKVNIEFIRNHQYRELRQKMADLKRKSIRMDHTHTLNLTNQYPWAWAPTRDIKIKKVVMSEDIPSTQGGTMWWWLSIGAAVFLNPTTDPNEEETIFAMSHLRQETDVGLPAMNQSWTFDFGSDHIEVEEGEKIYLGVDGGTGQMVGFSLIIFYI